MWDKPNIVITQAETKNASFALPVTPDKATIDDVINTSNAFWKSMHPDFQKIYELGSTLSKVDDTTDSALLESMFKSIIIFYKQHISQSDLTIEQKEEENKKIQVIESQIDLLIQTFRILKKPVDINSLSAYILGYNVNLLKRNKNN